MTTTPTQDKGIELGSLAAIPFGIFTTAIVIMIAVMSVAKAEFNPIAFSVFLIVPLGAIIAGGLAGSGLAGALWYLQRRPTIVAHGVALLLGLACFFGIYYGIYDRTYVDDNFGINHRGEGNHISAFVNPESGEVYTFWRYLELDVRNRDFSVYYRGQQVDLIDVAGPVGGWLNWALFGLEGLGMVAGSLTAVELLGKLDYCKSSRRYMRATGFLSIAPESLPTVWARLRSAVPDQSALNAAAIDAERPAHGEPFVRIDAVCCGGCGAGKFTARSYTKMNAKNRYEQAASARLTIGVASQLAGLAPAPAATVGLTGREPSIYDLN